MAVSRTMLGLVMAACLGFSGCGGSAVRSTSTAGVDAERHVIRYPSCEKNPKDGVHGPDRLTTLEGCAVFEGTVSQAPEKNPDGDVSFDVSPDGGYADMLNAHNRHERGLHIEIEPRDQPGCTPGQTVHVGDVPNLGICSGRDIVAPRGGAHVRIIGPWVLDRNDSWYEIHPAWSIKAASCRVPRVIGQTLRQARATIARHACSIGRISRRSSRKRLKGHVLSQHPRPGSLLSNHARINLTVGSGPPT